VLKWRRCPGRLRESSLQALLRELAAFNTGLCVITTRTAVADIADHERTSALRRDLEHLSSDAGAKVLRALGVKGDEAELRSASDEFSGWTFFASEHLWWRSFLMCLYEHYIDVDHTEGNSRLAR
jgi:hypothetical protein